MPEFADGIPSTPTAIIVPEEVIGGQSLTITWTIVSGDADILGCILERQVDSGTWSEIYNGRALTYTDTIGIDWTTVAYRVQSYESSTNKSEYIVSPVRTVILIKSAAFDITGDTFMQLLNGSHTMTITASDGTENTVHTLTFTKEVTRASVTLAEPLDADARIDICRLSVIGSIPADANFTVEVTNNAKDDDPVWENCTAAVQAGENHVFANHAAQKGFAFNFKVVVERGPSGEGGYIDSVQGSFL